MSGARADRLRAGDTVSGRLVVAVESVRDDDGNRRVRATFSDASSADFFPDQIAGDLEKLNLPAWSQVYRLPD